MEAQANDVSVKLQIGEGPDGQIKLDLSPSQQEEAPSIVEACMGIGSTALSRRILDEHLPINADPEDAAPEASSELPSSSVVETETEVSTKEAPEPAQFSSVPLEDEPFNQEVPTDTNGSPAEEPSSQAQELTPKSIPPLPSPFFPAPGNPSTAAATDASPGTPTRQSSTPRGMPVSQNGTTEANGFSPPSSPHPLDNPRPPTFLQVDVTYRDLLFTDGYDSHGRPVIVLNTSALPHKSRKDEVLDYLKQQLAPIVQQGPYVLVLVACSDGPKYKALPSLWTLAAYRSLARPFRKNVKFIVMVNPALLVRAVLAVLKPIVKKKAYSKLKQVKVLSDIDQATNGEVRLEHTGPRFISFLQQRSAS